MVKIYTCFQTKTSQKPYPLGRHYLYSLYRGVSPSPGIQHPPNNPIIAWAVTLNPGHHSLEGSNASVLCFSRELLKEFLLFSFRIRQVISQKEFRPKRAEGGRGNGSCLSGKIFFKVSLFTTYYN